MSSSSMFNPWLPQQQPKPSDTSISTKTKSTIRIQTTDESELTDIASLLATASQQLLIQDQDAHLKQANPWQNKIDLLFAKSDVEKLIRQRWRIIDIGKKASTQAKKQLLLLQQQQQLQQGKASTGSIQQDSGDDIFLKYFWSSNDALRNEIQVAASETGEDTVWQHHLPMMLTPSSSQWFNHVQMSATLSSTTTNSGTVKASSATRFSFFNKEKEIDSFSKVVGFCEVAMLSNPIFSTNLTMSEHYCKSGNSNDCIISIRDRNQQSLYSEIRTNYYSPAIANLAVDVTMRRRGIATKLLQRAECYVQRYWINARTMGLYVSTTNMPAIRLYEKCGYHKIMTVPSSASNDKDATDRSPGNGRSMWYMSKEIKRK